MGDDIVPRSARRKRLVMRTHLLKDSDGLGIQIAGGKGSKKGDLGIFITKIEPNKAAFRDNRLRKGDELLVIDGQSLIGRTHREAVELLRRSKKLIQLVVATKYKSEAELLLAEAGTGAGSGGGGGGGGLGDDGSVTSGSLQESSDLASEPSREEVTLNHHHHHLHQGDTEQGTRPVKEANASGLLQGLIDDEPSREVALNSVHHQREDTSTPVKEGDTSGPLQELTVEPSSEVVLNSVHYQQEDTSPLGEGDGSQLEEGLWDKIVAVNGGGVAGGDDCRDSLVVEVLNMTLGDGDDPAALSEEGSPQQLSRLIGQYTQQLEEYQQVNSSSPDSSSPASGGGGRESPPPEVLLASIHSSVFGDTLQSTANSDSFGGKYPGRGGGPNNNWHQLDIAGTLDLGFRVEEGSHGDGAVGGVFVNSLVVKEVEESEAACDIRVGDQVLEVNGRGVGSMAYSQVVTLLLDLPPNVQVLFGRGDGHRVLARFTIGSKGRVRLQDRGEGVDDLWAVVESNSPSK